MASLEQLTVGIPNAGRTTLLAALEGLAEASFPDSLRLCVLDAERMDAPAQIALVDELAADPLLDVIFALNKADRITGPRTVITRTLALLRERGFRRPTLYPVCARAAMLFSLPTEQIAGEELMSELGNYYFRYSPGEQSLSAFAVTRDSSLCLGSREITPEQLRLAVSNTGVPALAAALEALRLPDEAPDLLRDAEEFRNQASEDNTVGAATGRSPEAASSEEPVGAAAGRPPEAEAPNEATGSGQQATDPLAGTSIACPLPPAPTPPQEAALDNGQQATEEEKYEAPVTGDQSPEDAECEPVSDDSAGAAAGRPPEAEAPNEAAGNGQQATEEEEYEASVTGDQSPEDAECESVSDDSVGTATGRPPEANPSEEPVTAPIDLSPEAAPSEEPVTAPIDLPPEAAPADPVGADAHIGPSGSDAPDPVLDTLTEAPSDDPLAELLALAKTANCQELLELARSVPAVKAPDELRDQALDVLHAAYQTRQAEELDALTAGAEDLELNELRDLVDRIAAGPYTVQARTPYTARLNEKIDAIQSAELASLCADVETADAGTLARIREALDQTDCAEVLKTEHYRRVEDRQETLDREALERVTAGAEQMSEKELRALAVTLEANNWNPKFVTGYRHRIDLLIEAAQYRQVQEELADLNDMERREVLALRERIAEKELPARFTVGAAARIEEKLYRLDMLRLMALNNDLERLDFEGLDELRAVVARGDYCDRARKEYLGRLLIRENGLIRENASARAELTRQLIAQHKLRMSDFVLSTSGRDYDERLQDFWGGTGLEQPRDIPVFLFDNASDYAMTGTRFYYKAGRNLAFVPIESIDRFQVMRQHLSLNLQIVGKDNSYRLTDAKISRSGLDRTLEFLNDCVRRWAEPGPPTNRGQAADYRLPRLDAAEFTAPVESEYPSSVTAWNLFCDAYMAAGLREGNLVRLEDGSSMQRLEKMRASYGLPQNTPIVWYEPLSRLGPVKDGAVIGRRAVYWKEGKLPIRSIPIEEICEVRATGSKRVSVSSLRNETLTLEISESMAPLLLDFVRTIQLGDWLRGAGEKA